MATPQDRYIRVGRINTRYWAEGREGSPVLLIHGIGGYVENWLPCFEILAEQHRVYALDLIGEGRTDKPLDLSYCIADQTQFVRDFMAALELEHAHVIGHSLGGAIATRLAFTFPEAVDKLVLVAPAGLGREVTMLLRLSSVPLLGEMLTRPSRSGSENLFRAAVYDPEVVTDELIDQGFEMAALPAAQQAFLKILRDNGSFFGQRKSMYGPNIRGLAAITNPVLLVWGQQDQIIPVSQAEVASEGLPNVRVEILDCCGHLPMLECCAAFNKLLLEFLGDQPLP